MFLACTGDRLGDEKHPALVGARTPRCPSGWRKLQFAAGFIGGFLERHTHKHTPTQPNALGIRPPHEC